MRDPLAATLWRFSFATLLLLASAAAGLDPKNAITQYGHTAWRVRDGYFAGAPTTIAQTTDGFLWIGTQAGLIRFDGVQFVPWQPPAGSHLPDDRIVNLLGSSDGSLWIGTVNGVARWHASKLTVYARAGRFGALLEDRKGRVWLGHTRALTEVPPLCRFERERMQCFQFPAGSPLRYVAVLREDREGNIWLGGQGGICRWRPEKPECYEIGTPAGVGTKSMVFEIVEESNGSLLALLGPGGAWERAAGHWQPYRGLPDPKNMPEAILSDREQSVWFGIEGHGLLRHVQGRTERFTRNDGLSSDDVDFIFEDREGNVWVATFSGLDRFRDVRVATLTAQEGLPAGSIVAVAASRDGSLWVAEKYSLAHLEKSGISVFGAAQGLPGGGPTSLLEDSLGRLWVGVDNGLGRLDHGRFVPTTMPDGSAVGTVRAIAEDRAGDVWIATTHQDHTVCRLRDDRVVTAFSTAQLGDQAASLAADAEGGMWVGFTSRIVKIDRDGHPKGIQLPSPGWIHGLLPDARGLWVATSKGLGLLRNGRWDVLGTRNGLPCESLYDLAGAGDGSLWLTATCGLVQVSQDELAAWAANPARRVKARLLDGLDGVQTARSPFSPRSARTTDGRLWFAAQEGGLQVLDPMSLKSKTLPPPVQILRTVADRRIYPPVSGLRLPPLTRDIEIDYTALSLAVPEKVRFRYRLDGSDDDWQDAGTRRQAFFTNLSPGKYRFRVLASDRDGIWSPAGATLAFAIRPAFHQTPAFFALCAAAFLALTWWAYRWRLRQVRTNLDRRFEERLAERTRIAQDLHDTLLQGFLSASMQLYAVVEELAPVEPAKSRLDRVQELMRQVIDEGRGALRGLRSAETKEDDLAPALARIPAELGDPEGVDFRIVVEGRARPVFPVVRDEIYRISREAVVNAFRHSGASTIEVEIEYTPRRLRVVVRDDGRGIDPEVLRAGREGHWGLPGMRERAEALGARLQVWSRAGTEIELAVPGKVAYAP